MSDSTTKKGKETQGVKLETVSPLGHEEAEAQYAKEAMGDGAATKPLKPEKEQKPTIQEDNPKHPDTKKAD